MTTSLDLPRRSLRLQRTALAGHKYTASPTRKAIKATLGAQPPSAKKSSRPHEELRDVSQKLAGAVNELRSMHRALELGHRTLEEAQQEIQAAVETAYMLVKKAKSGPLFASRTPSLARCASLLLFFPGLLKRFVLAAVIDLMYLTSARRWLLIRLPPYCHQNVAYRLNLNPIVKNHRIARRNDDEEIRPHPSTRTLRRRSFHTYSLGQIEFARRMKMV